MTQPGMATLKQIGLLLYKMRNFGDSIPPRVRKGCDYKWQDLSDALETITGREVSEMIKMAEAAIENDIHPRTLLSRIEEVQTTYRAEKKCKRCQNVFNSCHCE